MIYIANTTEFVSADIGHPLVPKLVIRFYTKTSSPETVIENFQKEASSLCENVLSTV